MAFCFLAHAWSVVVMEVAGTGAAGVIGGAAAGAWAAMGGVTAEGMAGLLQRAFGFMGVPG